MIKIQVGGFRRISKAAARKEYDKGNDVFLMSCKLSPSSPWYYPVMVNKDGNTLGGETFDKMCNAFAYYNCNSEMGRYLAFYTLDD